MRCRLVNAIWAGDGAAVKALTAADAALVSATLDCYETPLHMASKLDNKEILKDLLRAGAAVDARSIFGETPLLVAAIYDKMEMMEELLRSGATVLVANNKGETPLINAARHGRHDMVVRLLRAGAAVDAADNHGRRTLHAAAFGGHLAMVQELLRAGATVDARDEDSGTPLREAGCQGHKEVVEELLRAGAAVEAVDKFGQTLLSLVIGNGLWRPDDADVPRAWAVVRVLVGWRAAVPAELRPSGVRTVLSRNKRAIKQLRAVLDTARVLSHQDIRDAKAEWLAATAKARDKVAAAGAAATALAELRSAHDGFVAAPETLTLEAIREQLPRTRIRDVRCLRLAHGMLLFADRVGVFAREDGGITSQRRIDVFEQVYQPAVGWLDADDRGLVAAIVRHAAEKGLIDQLHVSVMGVALELDRKLASQLVMVLERLHHIEAAVSNAGALLCSTVEELRTLQVHLRDKEERDRKVALAKSAIKIGVSLAPIVGGALNAGVDAVAAFGNGAAQMAVVCQHLADPTDVAAARHILRCVGDGKHTMNAAQLQQLQTIVYPYMSLEAVDADLAFVEDALLDAGAGDGIIQGDTAVAECSSSAAEEPAFDVAEGKVEKLKDVATDAVVEHAVDKVADERRGRLQQNADTPPRKSLATTARELSGSGSTLEPASTRHCHNPPVCPETTASDGVGAPASPLPVASSPRAPPLSATADSVAGRLASPHPVLHLAPAPASDEQVGDTRVPAVTPRRGGDDGRLDAEFGAPFFAGVMRWDCNTLATKLVAYVASNYASPKRAAFDTVVHDCADAHDIDGTTLVRCRDPAETTSYLLGSYKARHGVVVSVGSFIEDAKRYAALS